MRILLVEDDACMSELVTRDLEDEGHAVCVAYTVNEAKDVLATGIVEAVITDLGLPWSDVGQYGDRYGLTVANAAKQAGLPVVIASGNDALVAMAKAAGWHAYVKDYRMVPDLLADLEAQRKEATRAAA